MDLSADRPTRAGSAWVGSPRRAAHAGGHGQRVPGIEQLDRRSEGPMGVLLADSARSGSCRTQSTDVFRAQDGASRLDSAGGFGTEPTRAAQSRRAAIGT